MKRLTLLAFAVLPFMSFASWTTLSDGSTWTNVSPGGYWNKQKWIINNISGETDLPYDANGGTDSTTATMTGVTSTDPPFTAPFAPFGDYTVNREWSTPAGVVPAGHIREYDLNYQQKTASQAFLNTSNGQIYGRTIKKYFADGDRFLNYP